MHRNARDVSRDEAVKQSKQDGIQQEEQSLAYDTKSQYSVEPGSPYDFTNYIPIGHVLKHV